MHTHTHTDLPLPLHRGESKTFQKGKVTGVSWKDNRVVNVLSTNTQPAATSSVLRRQKDGTRISVSCPESIMTYNQHMGGVDRGDQLRGYYSCRTKSKKFYKYVFMFLFDVAITNAYILYKHANAHPKLKNIKEFRLQLAKKLIAQYCSRRRAGRTGGAIVPLQLQHFPLKDWTAPCPSKRRRGRCSHCSERGNRTDTSWYCEE